MLKFQSGRNLEMVYLEFKMGVFIQDINGNLYTEDEWDGTQTANGVAVITLECEFVVALTDSSSTMAIADNNLRRYDNYMTALKSESVAKADYDGATNTDNMIKVVSSTDLAAGWCNAFSFPNGKKGFLPSLGQMNAACNNRSAINEALSKAGGTAFKSKVYWTSSFFGADSSGVRKFWALNWNDSEIWGGDSEYTTYNVRAFATFDK